MPTSSRGEGSTLTVDLISELTSLGFFCFYGLHGLLLTCGEYFMSITHLETLTKEKWFLIKKNCDVLNTYFIHCFSYKQLFFRFQAI